jgi:hypothetical protein
MKNLMKVGVLVSFILLNIFGCTKDDITSTDPAAAIAENKAIIANEIYVENPGENNDIVPNIANAVNMAKDGDIIFLPEGQFAFIGYIETKKKLSFKGAGINKTVLYRPSTLSDDEIQWKPMLKIILSDDKPCGIVISGIHFKSKPYTESTAIDHGLEISNAVDIVIHDCKFENFGECGIYLFHKENIARGLIYNCEFYHNFKGNGQGYGYGIQIDALAKSWVKSPKFGTSNFIFIENNTFEFHRHAITSGQGGLYVARYNTIKNNLLGNAIDMHEARDASGFSSRASEIYNNTITNTLFGDGTPLVKGMGEVGGGLLASTAICIRGGEAVVYNNSSEGFRYGIELAAAWYLWGDAYPIKTQQGYASALVYGPNDTGFDAAHGDGDIFMWNNNHVVYQCPDPFPAFINDHGTYTKENRDYHFKIKPGYVPYTYPHPLRIK